MRSDSCASGGMFLTWTTRDGVPLLLLEAEDGSSRLLVDPFMVVVVFPFEEDVDEEADADGSLESVSPGSSLTCIKGEWVSLVHIKRHTYLFVVVVVIIV